MAIRIEQECITWETKPRDAIKLTLNNDVKQHQLRWKLQAQSAAPARFTSHFERTSEGVEMFADEYKAMIELENGNRRMWNVWVLNTK
jgi:hypothetical protein